METKKMISFEGTSCLKEALRVEAFKNETTGGYHWQYVKMEN